MIQLLTAPQVLAAPASTYRYMVELASIETVLDSKGVPVPAFVETLDVVVTEPSLGAITTLLADKGHLDGHQIVKHWVPADCNCF